MDLHTIVNGIVLDKVCSIKADKDSDESKAITLRVKFDGVSLRDVFTKAVSSAVIQWQNGPGRNKFDTWTNNQVVEIDFKAPGRVQTDPVADVIGRAKAMSKEARITYLKDILGQIDEAEGE